MGGKCNLSQLLGPRLGLNQASRQGGAALFQVYCFEPRERRASRVKELEV